MLNGPIKSSKATVSHMAVIIQFQYIVELMLLIVLCFTFPDCGVILAQLICSCHKEEQKISIQKLRAITLIFIGKSKNKKTNLRHYNVV